MDAIGHTTLKQRLEKGLRVWSGYYTKSSLAEAAGLSLSQFNAFMTKAPDPKKDPSTYRALAQRLGVKRQWLATGEGVAPTWAADEDEHWASLPDLPAYEFSNYGRVRDTATSRPRFIWADKWSTRTYLSGKFTDVRGVSNIYRVHEVVCTLFNGAAPEGKPYVRHLNKRYHDNFYKNLEWTDEPQGGLKERVRFNYVPLCALDFAKGTYYRMESDIAMCNALKLPIKLIQRGVKEKTPIKGIYFWEPGNPEWLEDFKKITDAMIEQSITDYPQLRQQLRDNT